MTKNKKNATFAAQKTEVMPAKSKTKKKDHPIEEARRYYDNAEELLTKNGQLNDKKNLYEDDKYVRMAGDTLWKGCLIALDAVFKVKDKAQKGQRVDIADYRNAVTKRDKKLLDFVNTGYETMHLYMGYDGTKSKKTCEAGFDMAKSIIDRCAILYKA